MLITPKDNPYGYEFEDIVDDIKLAILQSDNLVKTCRKFGFSLHKIRTAHSTFRLPLLKVFYLSKKLDLIIKVPIIENSVPNFEYLMPTFFFPFKSRTVSIQPLGDIPSREKREKLAAQFKDQLIGFDCHADNFVIFKDKPALIDW